MMNTKFLVMDVDGTLTDGKIYMGQDGELAKAFDIKDGCGILLELPLYGIIPVIITARESLILKNRCEELKIKELHQGVKDKLSKLREIVGKFGESLSAVAYAGDDLPDIPCMEEVKKAGGIVLCPADAISEIKSMADYISGHKAGEGAVRDMIRYLGNHVQKTNIQTKIDETVKWILSTDFSVLKAGTYQRDDGTVYSIQEYFTREEKENIIESHRNHIDIQFMITGKEVFKIYSTSCLSSSGKYDNNKDADYWLGGQVVSQNILVPGSLIVVLNGQPHKGAISCSVAEKVKKLVCKLEVFETEHKGAQ